MRWCVRWCTIPSVALTEKITGMNVNSKRRGAKSLGSKSWPTESANVLTYARLFWSLSAEQMERRMATDVC